MNELKYPSKETINKLTRDLELIGAHEFTQDWEYEVADYKQLARYIEYYEGSNLNTNEKTTLMRIILEAYNDYVVMENQYDSYGAVIKKFLEQDYSIYTEIIQYWACEGEELEDCFAITSFMRKVRKTQISH